MRLHWSHKSYISFSRVSATIAALVLPTVAVADAVQWTEAEGGNGHWYEAVYVGPDLSWSMANSLTIQFGGYLATPVTSEEDNWIISTLLSDDTHWGYNNNYAFGPHIGGWQNFDSPDYSEPGGGWEWITEETFAYNNWLGLDNCCGGQDRMQYFKLNGDIGWADVALLNDQDPLFTSYIIEWSADCNGDGIVDYGQILDGTFEDVDVNGVPDTCEMFQWRVEDGGNGHWYSYRLDDLNNAAWTALAEAEGAHLVTITSEEEGVFVEAVHDAAAPQTAYHTGGYQDISAPDYAEPGGGWRWVTGEPWQYTNWGFSDGAEQPDDQPNFGEGANVVGIRWQENGIWLDAPETTEWAAMFEWSADCNDDGIVDYGQILDGTYPDTNGNGVPDCCEDGSCLEDGDPTTSQWIKPDGGSFHDADNWSTSAPPNQNMTAILEIDAEYTITFEDDVQTMNLKSLNGDVTLDLGGYIYTASNDNSTAIIGENAGDQAALGITSGLLEFGSGVSGEAELVLGYGAQSQGDLHVTGADARLNVHKLRIGDHGSGLMTIAEGGRVHVERVSLGNTIGSMGLLQLAGDGTVLIAKYDASINHGIVDISSPGEFQISDEDARLTIFKDGLVTGDGTITGEILNRGRFAPDMSETAFQVLGDYKNRGVLMTTIGETSHSRLNVFEHDQWSGEASLGGGLLVQLDLDFLPEIDAEFQILEAEDRVKDIFDVAFMPDLGDDRYMTVRYPDPGLRGGEENVDLVVVGFEDYLGFDKPVPVELDGQPEAMAVADLDGDGDDDIAVSTPGWVTIYFNNNGIFDSDFKVEVVNQVNNEDATSVDLVTGDFNGDEFLDLAGANAANDTVAIIISNGDGTFMTAQNEETDLGTNPQGLATADFNNDGRDDLAISCTGTGQVKIWRSQAGRGVPDFEFIEDAVIDVGGAPIGIDPGEVEEDKDLDRIDLVVALSGEGKVGVLRNNTTTSSEVIKFLFDPADDKHVVGQGPTSVALADLDGDAHVDIVTANPADGSISILLHNETSAAEFLTSVDLPVGTAARSVALADLDNDGDQDIAIIAIGEDGGTFGLYVLRNDSNLTNYEQLLIAPAESFTIPGIPVLVDDGDLDSNGVPDLVTINDAGSGLRGESGTLGLVRSDPACPDDLDGSGVVDISDLLLLLADWSDPYTIKDLLQLLGSWGPCP